MSDSNWYDEYSGRIWYHEEGFLGNLMVKEEVSEVPTSTADCVAFLEKHLGMKGWKRLTKQVWGNTEVRTFAGNDGSIVSIYDHSSGGGWDDSIVCVANFDARNFKQRIKDVVAHCKKHYVACYDSMDIWFNPTRNAIFLSLPDSGYYCVADSAKIDKKALMEKRDEDGSYEGDWKDSEEVYIEEEAAPYPELGFIYLETVQGVDFDE